MKRLRKLAVLCIFFILGCSRSETSTTTATPVLVTPTTELKVVVATTPPTATKLPPLRPPNDDGEKAIVDVLAPKAPELPAAPTTPGPQPRTNPADRGEPEPAPIKASPRPTLPLPSQPTPPALPPVKLPEDLGS